MPDGFHFCLYSYADNVLFTYVETASFSGVEAFAGVAHEGICVGDVAEAGAIVFDGNHRGVAIRLWFDRDAAFGRKGSFIPCVLDQFLHEIPRFAVAV